jgi:hydrogenase/urease accessory protein HupE
VTFGRAAVVLLLVVLADGASAHRLSPAFFGLTETAPNVFQVQWKVSISGGLAATLEPQVPDGCSINGAVRSYSVEDVRFQHAEMACPEGLAGREFEVDGLPVTQTDVLLRVDYLDGTSSNQRLTPERSRVLIPERPSRTEVIKTYTVLGVEHILLGIDHLLFVLALLLLIREPWMLVKTITAFTIAHSITLAAAALGWAEAPQAPVETVVALSIVFAAAEVARERGNAADLASRSPWIMAFAFGLLHGFGFGGALKEIGLPQSDVPLALLAFNLGVEAGQLLFVAAVLALVASLDRLLALALPRLRDITAYAIGSLAAAWFVQRLAGLAGIA